jgi:hypothetical protein
MRISADSTSPYWREDVVHTDVLLDGMPLRNCTEADDVEGWADVILSDENGIRLEPDPDRPGSERIVIARLRGRVEFTSTTEEGSNAGDQATEGEEGEGDEADG